MSSTRIRPARTALVLLVLAGLVAAALGGVTLLRHGDSAAGAATTWTGTPGRDDGYIADGKFVSITDDVPAITRLDPGLRAAVAKAAQAAKDDGVWFVITSGWRSGDYQRWLYSQAVTAHGEAAARERVAEPGTSAHEVGRAVDIGWTDADSWMMQHGAEFGLCQIYTNEIWHYELATTPGGECPEQLAGAEAR